MMKKEYFTLLLFPENSLKIIKEKGNKRVIYFNFIAIFLINLLFLIIGRFYFNVPLRISIYLLIFYPILIFYLNLIYFFLSKIFNENINFIDQLKVTSFVEVPLTIFSAISFYIISIIYVSIIVSLYRMFLYIYAIKISNNLSIYKALFVVLIPGILFSLLYLG